MKGHVTRVEHIDCMGFNKYLHTLNKDFEANFALCFYRVRFRCFPTSFYLYLAPFIVYNFQTEDIFQS